MLSTYIKIFLLLIGGLPTYLLANNSLLGLHHRLAESITGIAQELPRELNTIRRDYQHYRSNNQEFYSQDSSFSVPNDLRDRYDELMDEIEQKITRLEELMDDNSQLAMRIYEKIELIDSLQTNIREFDQLGRDYFVIRSMAKVLAREVEDSYLRDGRNGPTRFSQEELPELIEMINTILPTFETYYRIEFEKVKDALVALPVSRWPGVSRSRNALSARTVIHSVTKAIVESFSADREPEDPQQRRAMRSQVNSKMNEFLSDNSKIETFEMLFERAEQEIGYLDLVLNQSLDFRASFIDLRDKLRSDMDQLIRSKSTLVRSRSHLSLTFSQLYN